MGGNPHDITFILCNEGEKSTVDMFCECKVGLKLGATLVGGFKSTSMRSGKQSYFGSIQGENPTKTNSKSLSYCYHMSHMPR